MRLLVSAEAFGFGPASKLHAICVELRRRGIDCHFVGADVSLAFANDKSAAFTTIQPLDSMQELGTIAPEQYDGVVSVMDPHAVLWAALHDRPCLYVDSLYWMWRWDALDTDAVRSWALELVSGGAGAFSEFMDVPMHTAQYMAHFLATETCAQRSPIERSVDRDERAGPGVVDAIVDLSHRSPSDQTHWLVSTGGLLSALVGFDEAVRWTTIVADLVSTARREVASGTPLAFVGNRRVLDAVQVEHPDIQILRTDHESFLRALNRAQGCLAPPGLTTMFECGAYGVPMIFLPAQHYGHTANAATIERCHPGSVFGSAHSSASRDSGFDGDVASETRAILENLGSTFDARDHRWTRLVGAVAESMAEIERDRVGVHARQDRAARAFAGGYDGVAQVVERLDAMAGISR
jgi:hypothetical protein